MFTSAIDNDRPTDALSAVGPDDDALCLSGRWFDLPRAPQPYRYELRDAAGKVVNVGETEVTATAATWYTWSCYRPTAADAPGTWTYALTLGDATLEGAIEVAPRPTEAMVLGALSGDAGILGSLSDEDAAKIFADLDGPPPANPATNELGAALGRCVEDHPNDAPPAAIAFTVATDGALTDVRAEGEGPLARCLERALAGVKLASTRAAPLEVRVPLAPGGVAVRGG